MLQLDRFHHHHHMINVRNDAACSLDHMMKLPENYRGNDCLHSFLLFPSRDHFKRQMFEDVRRRCMRSEVTSDGGFLFRCLSSSLLVKERANVPYV